ncbi:MAG: type II toxin-antitoxin system PemK/MazF family toxin [Proteobacteria bacterium]|nr:type II toxin-antitoxin system PemK/MazF family toxin [Pseudomonadota bacterium]
MGDRHRRKTLNLPGAENDASKTSLEDHKPIVGRTSPVYTEPRPPETRPPIIKSAPRIRQVYWCDFPSDAVAPEMWKRRPVVIFSPRNKLSGCVVVVPCTTFPQGDNEWAVPISSGSIQRDGWAICDKISSVSVSRLLPMVSGKPMPRVSDREFEQIVRTVFKFLPDPGFGKS